MSNRLMQLVYASKAQGIDVQALEDILKAARENNKACGVTGALMHTGKYFVQVLEGSRRQVSSIFCNKICRDSRHIDLELLSMESIRQRSFADWSMAFVGDTKDRQGLSLKYSGSDVFDPYTMGPKSLLLLMEELMSQSR